MSNGLKSRMTLKHLESYLQTLDDFDEPKLELEQYATPPHIAALMLNVIDTQYHDLENKFVADLGCGTGRLSIGSVLCGASLVFGFDLDRGALDTALQNVIDFFADLDDEDGVGDLAKAYSECGDINFIQADLSQSTSGSATNWKSSFQNKFDTVIMNPPFGTKHNNGLDMVFLRTAIDMSDHVVYSLHKSSTRQYILGKCKDWGLSGKPIAQFKYNLDNTYKFHKKKSVDIDVDFWRIERH